MYKYLYVEINTFSIIILALIFFNLYHKKANFTTEIKLYQSIIISNFLILLVDTFMIIADHRITTFYRLVLIISTVLFFILQPIISLHWALYVDFQINRDKKRLKNLHLFFILPIIINAILTIISLFYKFFFYIDDNNVYHRGRYFYIIPIIGFSYIFFTVLYLLKNRRRITGTYFRSFIFCAFWPIAGAIIQLKFYGLPMIYTGMTISILLIFINIQNQQMSHDYLTGLNNRRQLDIYLQNFSVKSRNRTAGVFVDINSFKGINDRFGHSTGDEALRHTAELLRKSFPSHSFLSRIGGDEFVILFEIYENSELTKSLSKLKKNLKQYNQINALPCQLNFSIGADIYNSELNMSGQEFLNHIDKLMYLEKKK